jgi:hypothetical protein
MIDVKAFTKFAFAHLALALLFFEDLLSEVFIKLDPSNVTEF